MIYTQEGCDTQGLRGGAKRGQIILNLHIVKKLVN